MAGAKLRCKLGRWVNRGINLPSQPPLRIRQFARDRCYRGIADDHEIDIAGALLPAGGKRAEDKRDADLPRNLGQRSTQAIGQSNCLYNQALKFRMDRRCGIRAVEKLMTQVTAAQDARLRQQFQFSLHRPRARAGQPGNPADVKLLIWARQKQPQHASARLAKEQ